MFFKGMDEALEEALSILTVKVKLSLKDLVPFVNVCSCLLHSFLSFSV